jgi:hypothetical protein
MFDEIHLFARDYINDKSFRTTGRKRKIREAYKILTGKSIKITCSTCYLEALFEIINNTKIMSTPNYQLKKGVLLQAFGDASKTCTNDTLTDELAVWYLAHYPEKAIYFARMPQSEGNFNQPPAGIRIVPPIIPANVIIIPPDKIKQEEKIMDKIATDLIAGATSEPKKIVKKLIKARK